MYVLCDKLFICFVLIWYNWYLFKQIFYFELFFVNLEENSKSIKSWLYDVYNNELQDDCLLRLTVGAMMVEKLRESVYKKTGFRCSAGIANNKVSYPFHKYFR